MQISSLRLAKAAFLALSLSSNAFAQEKRVEIASKHLIANAVQVQITPRGQKYFENELQNILGNIGFNFGEGYFPPQKILANKPLDLKELEKTNPEGVKVYYMVKDLLTKWLVGFSLTDHRPAVEIGESGYTATFSRFALVTDEALMKQIGKRDGAVMAIDLVIQRMTIATQTVRAWDMNNMPFAKFGMDDVSVTAGDTQTPLKVRLPFYIQVNAQGGIEFEALQLQENLAEVPLTVQYKKLLVPQVTVEVEGHRYSMNTAQLQSAFDEQLPKILVEVRKYLSDFAGRQLPEILNQKVKENLSGALEQVQNMLPPGQDADPKIDPRPYFKWGLKLTHFQLQNSLNIGLGAYAEDPLNSNVPLVPTYGSRGAPTINDLPPSNYDIALSLDRGLINRILQLSFLRKNFEKIPQSDGTSLKLTAAPLVDYLKPPAATADNEAYLKLRVAVEVEPKKPLWLDDKIVLNFDIVAKLRSAQKSTQGGMEIAQQYIDVNSLQMDSKYLTVLGRLAELAGKVTDGIKDELKVRSKDWIRNNESIPGTLDLPPAILGMKLETQKVSMDPNGHLIMYLNYQKAPGAKQ